IITGVTGNTAANNTPANPVWTITVVDLDHFLLNGSVGNGTYAGGGTYTITSRHAWNFAVARLNAQNGLLDSSFSGGIVDLDFFQALFGGHNFGLGDDMAEHVMVQQDGKILVAGRTWM